MFFLITQNSDLFLTVLSICEKRIRIFQMQRKIIKMVDQSIMMVFKRDVSITLSGQLFNNQLKLFEAFPVHLPD